MRMLYIVNPDVAHALFVSIGVIMMPGLLSVFYSFYGRCSYNLVCTIA
uniref:Uncharacterized protein n=1 Tax=Arundo donax TaxID=35708 RepID=A0A0A9F296_ARUDO